jgi:hypothetical protein
MCMRLLSESGVRAKPLCLLSHTAHTNSSAPVEVEDYARSQLPGVCVVGRWEVSVQGRASTRGELVMLGVRSPYVSSRVLYLLQPGQINKAQTWSKVETNE